ncbi:hypothetical protein [Lysobacter humi (ex Lee et al. 2017)]
MFFEAYRRPDGALLLVPDCMLASREAQLRHGPLVALGRVHADPDRDDALWRRVLTDIDRQSYSIVRRDLRLDPAGHAPLALLAG